MNNSSGELPLIVIVGPTASGKSALAIEMAEKYNGEIICADSRTVYREMNIGTGKPTDADQKRVPHWGLDLIDPGQYFSAADFKEYAIKKINEIRNRGHVPFLVGGTGLYVDAIIFDYKFGTKTDESLRSSLQDLTVEALQEHCKNNNIKMPENINNKRYLIRAIESNGVTIRDNPQLIEDCIVVGIATDKPIIMNRIESRIHSMIDDGAIDETTKLAQKYGWGSESMKSNIYQNIKRYLDNEISLDELLHKSITIDWRLAKRQITWLKRNKFIQWFNLENARIYIDKYLASIW